MRKMILAVLCFSTLMVKAQDYEKEFPGILPPGNEDAVKYYRKIKNKYGLKLMQKVYSGKVWLGISDELCDFGLGEPNRKKTTITKDGKTEIWIYHGLPPGCTGVGLGCQWLDYVITFKDHKAISITEGD